MSDQVCTNKDGHSLGYSQTPFFQNETSIFQSAGRRPIHIKSPRDKKSCCCEVDANEQFDPLFAIPSILALEPGLTFWATIVVGDRDVLTSLVIVRSPKYRVPSGLLRQFHYIFLSEPVSQLTPSHSEIFEGGRLPFKSFEFWCRFVPPPRQFLRSG